MTKNYLKTAENHQKRRNDVEIFENDNDIVKTMSELPRET